MHVARKSGHRTLFTQTIVINAERAHIFIPKNCKHNATVLLSRRTRTHHSWFHADVDESNFSDVQIACTRIFASAPCPTRSHRRRRHSIACRTCKHSFLLIPPMVRLLDGHQRNRGSFLTGSNGRNRRFWKASITEMRDRGWITGPHV